MAFATVEVSSIHHASTSSIIPLDFVVIDPVFQLVEVATGVYHIRLHQESVMIRRLVGPHWSEIRVTLDVLRDSLARYISKHFRPSAYLAQVVDAMSCDAVIQQMSTQAPLATLTFVHLHHLGSILVDVYIWP